MLSETLLKKILMDACQKIRAGVGSEGNKIALLIHYLYYLNSNNVAATTCMS